MVACRTAVWAVLVALLGCALARAGAPVLETNDCGFALQNTTQRIRVECAQADAPYTLAVDVQRDGKWVPLFDAARPLAEGTAFGLQATAAAVARNDAAGKALVLRGRQVAQQYDWTLLIELNTTSPLAQFTLTCDFPREIKLAGHEPSIAFWMRQSTATLTLDQGPDNIYAGLPDFPPRAIGFPAAYLWDSGREAAFFFDFSPATWVRPDGIARLYNLRAQTVNDAGQTGLGLHFYHASGANMPAGRAVFHYYLYAGARARRPSKLEALGAMLETFAPLMPATSEFPAQTTDGSPVTWANFCARAVRDLMVPGHTFSIQDYTWKDLPLALVPNYPRLISHPGGVTDDPNAVKALGDFSLVNNHLTPWTLYSRLHPEDKQAAEFAAIKRNSLPRFYDARSRTIRYGFNQPMNVGDVDMSWQNFFFHVETIRAAEAAAPGDFNPAVLGRFLMATRGLIEYAHHVDYNFPQWFDPYRKVPANQADVPKLKVAHEPWQGGSYAYLMMRAYEFTGERQYLDEARVCIETLLTRMRYRVDNDVRHHALDDPAEFPITEIFGHAYGLIGAHKVQQATGDARFAGYSRDFMNTMLRLCTWFEDAADAPSRELRNEGLFYPHGGGFVQCPWETVEANLGLAWVVAAQQKNPLRELALKICNLNRVNGFYFHPAAFGPAVRALDPKRRTDYGQYFPIEPFYSSIEGCGGHIGPSAAYMAGLTMWNSWLYDALAEADNRELMVLNLDAMENFEPAMSSAQRRFVVFNPTEKQLQTRVRSHHLADGDYRVTIASGGTTTTLATKHSAADLRAGLPLTLRPHEACTLTLRHARADEMLQQIARVRQAQHRICHAYQLLQDGAMDGQSFALTPAATQRFHTAMEHYQRGDYQQATSAAAAIIVDLKQGKP
jgi:hypothetical protein